MDQTTLELSDRKRLAHLVRATQQHRILSWLVQERGWLCGAEIGVLKGKTLFALLDANPALSMIGVDQWQRLPLRKDENAETYADFDMAALGKAVKAKATKYGDRCRIIEADSAQAAKYVDVFSLDFVFIDGDHTEAGVERDIRAWLYAVRPGGMLLGHDCHWSTVRRVIDRLCPGWVDYGEAVWGVPVEAIRV